MTGASGAGGAAQSDFELLEACAAPEPCGTGYAQLIENATHNIHADTVLCLMNALGARTPGKYLHETDSTFSNGSVGAEHRLVVVGDEVAYARVRYTVHTGYERMAEPGQRCRLKPASYFEACADALVNSPPRDDAVAWACAFGDGAVTTPSTLEWFESCSEDSPARCD